MKKTILGQTRDISMGIMQTPLGDILLAGSNNALQGVWFMQQKYFSFDDATQGITPVRINSRGTSSKDVSPVISLAAQELDAYFAGKLRIFTTPLQPVGTPFQEKVWEVLLTVPYGSTIAYSDVAQRIGNPKGVRAVGTAVGRNPLSIFVPCHRIIGKSGKLVGFASGLDKKEALLRLEGYLL